MSPTESTDYETVTIVILIPVDDLERDGRHRRGYVYYASSFFKTYLQEWVYGHLKTFRSKDNMLTRDVSLESNVFIPDDYDSHCHQ
jgi:hypothetical protein